MANYITEIISFVAGGGLTTILSIGMNRKKANLEYTEKAIEFWAELNSKTMEQNDRLMERIVNCENQIKVLNYLKCEKNPCKNRIPPIELDA